MKVPTHNKHIADRLLVMTGRRGRVGALAAMILFALAPMAAAQGIEIHSNGRGGGLWSEPDTWHGRQVPGPNDTVVIAMRDRVVFDLHDEDYATCAALYLDPEAILTFQEGRQRRTMTVNGPIEAYGTIRIDGTGDRRGEYELRLVAESESDRVIRLLENAALLTYGLEQHRRGERNVRITADTLEGFGQAADTDDTDDNDDAPAPPRVPARITAEGEVMFDLHHTHLRDVEVHLSHLDNTGARPRERLNVIGSLFTGRSTLRIEHADTPAVRDTTFRTEAGIAPEHAIYVSDTALADLRGKVIEGPYATAILVRLDTDTSIRDVRITGAERGIYVRGENTAINGVEVVDAERGIEFDRADVVLENSVVRGAKLSFRLSRSNVQFTDVSAVDPWVEQPEQPEAEEGDDADEAEVLDPPVPEIIHLDRSSVRLINSPIEDDQITHSGSPPGDRPFVETMQYVIVRVLPKDAPAPQAGEGESEGAPQAGQRQRGAREILDLPRGLQVRVQTAEESGGVPEGRADLNVRNSPVPVSENGFTPMPRSQRAIAVRSWRIDRGGDFRQAPFYDLIIEAYPEGGGDDVTDRVTLVERMIEPRADWFRPEPNRPEPTIEVILP